MDIKPVVEIKRRAISYLYRELGAVDALRFLKRFASGLGDYPQEQEVLFASKTGQQMVSEIEQMPKPVRPALAPPPAVRNRRPNP